MARQPRSESALYRRFFAITAVGLPLGLILRPDGLPDFAWRWLVFFVAMAGAGYYAKERRAARLKAERDGSLLYQRNYNDDPGSFR